MTTRSWWGQSARQDILTNQLDALRRAQADRIAKALGLKPAREVAAAGRSPPSAEAELPDEQPVIDPQRSISAFGPKVKGQQLVTGAVGG